MWDHLSDGGESCATVCVYVIIINVCVPVSIVCVKDVVHNYIFVGKKASISYMYIIIIVLVLKERCVHALKATLSAVLCLFVDTTVSH